MFEIMSRNQLLLDKSFIFHDIEANMYMIIYPEKGHFSYPQHLAFVHKIRECCVKLNSVVTCTVYSTQILKD